MRGLESVELGFSDIQLVLQAKKKENGDRVLLDGSIRGKASPGRMLAIMGPSGAGKVCPGGNGSSFSFAVPLHVLTFFAFHRIIVDCSSRAGRSHQRQLQTQT
jgi:hypothetical protein